MSIISRIVLGPAVYEGYKAIGEYNKKILQKVKKDQEEGKEETRRFKASLDNEEGFKANFEPVNDYNWGMFKNED